MRFLISSYALASKAGVWSASPFQGVESDKDYSDHSFNYSWSDFLYIKSRRNFPALFFWVEYRFLPPFFIRPGFSFRRNGLRIPGGLEREGEAPGRGAGTGGTFKGAAGGIGIPRFNAEKPWPSTGSPESRKASPCLRLPRQKQEEPCLT